MKGWNWNFIIDFAVLLYGLYVLYGAVQMKTTGKIGPMVASIEEIHRCKNQEALIAKILNKMFAFALVAIAYGVYSIIDDAYLHFPFAIKAGLLGVFLVFCFWFIHTLQQARKEFIK